MTRLDQLQNQTVQTVHRFLCDFIKAHGYPPSHQEIADGMNLSRASIGRYLEQLEALGYISRQFYTPRAITIERHI